MKIMAGMDIAKKRLPQDGRSRIKTYDGKESTSGSTLRTLFGEKIVLRVLDHRKGALLLQELESFAAAMEEVRFLTRLNERTRPIASSIPLTLVRESSGDAAGLDPRPGPSARSGPRRSNRRSPRRRSRKARRSSLAVDVALVVEQVRLDQQAAAGLERRALTNIDGGDVRSPSTGAGRRRRRGRGRRARGSGTRLAVGKPSVRPRLSPWRPRRAWNGAPRSGRPCRRRPPRPGRGSGVDETISPSTSTSSTTRVSNASWARSRAGVARARGRRSGSSPRRTPCCAPSCSTSTWSMNSCAGLARRTRRRTGSRRARATPRPAIRSALVGERREQLRRRSGRDDRCAGAARR